MDMDFEKGLGPKIGDAKMNETKPESLVDTTDSLEAVSVFRAWKNFFFLVTICCLLLLQALFWLVDLEFVKAEIKPAADLTEQSAVADSPPLQELGTAEPVTVEIPQDVNEIQQAAQQVAEEPISATPTESREEETGLFGAITYKHVAWLIRLLDFVLILAAILYCLTMLFCLKVSMLGRLGGINHITRAFFLSLVFVVLLMPWQKFFGNAVKGAIYLPGELQRWLNWYGTDSSGVFAAALHYLRFTGYWFLVLLLLVLSMSRSSRWAKATLRRLEVI